MADLSKTETHLATTPDDHLDRLLVAGVEEGFFSSFKRNIQELIHPPKLPPLEVTSRPVAVKDIWGLYGRQKKSFFMSTGVQFLMIGMLIWAFSTKAVQNQVKTITSLVYSPPDIQEYQPKLAPK